MMNNLKSKILNDCFINIGSGVYQEHIIKFFKKKKIFLITTDINNKAKALKYADAKIIKSSSRHNDIFKSVIKIKKKKKLKIKGVITGCTRSAIYTTSYLGKKFNIPALNLKSAELISNKI